MRVSLTSIFYVSDNGGAFLPWVTQTKDTGDTYFGTLGHTYVFYSVATDNANNHEAPHTTPDAQTTVSLVNHPPTLDPIPDQTVRQGDVLRVQAIATDPDTNALTFSLLGTPPAGMQINFLSGLLTWITGGGTPPGTKQITVQVLDDGIPREGITRTFGVVVQSGANTPPVLAPIPNFIVSEDKLLVVTNTASDSDFPPQTLSFSLGTGAPTNATIDSVTGIFQWRPTQSQGGTTNTITVIVTDNGTPNLSVSRNFTVIVLKTLPDFVLSFGTTNLMIGATSAVRISVSSGLDVTNVAFTLTVPSLRLTNFALQPLVPTLSSAVLQPLGSNASQVTLTAVAGDTLQGSGALAQLSFTADTNEHSTIIPLMATNLLGFRTAGTALTNGLAYGGRVFLIGREPLLDATLTADGSHRIRVYGRPGSIYQVQVRTNLASAGDWIGVANLTLNSQFADVTNLNTSVAAVFYRVWETQPAAPLLEIQRLNANTVGLRFFGDSGGNYLLQTTTNLHDWTSIATPKTKDSLLNWTNRIRSDVPMEFFRIQRPR